MCGGCIINAEMHGGLIKKAVFIPVILVLISVGMVSGATNVSSCGTITSSSVYVLTQDLSNSSTCITIESSNVIFDGMGHTIDGNGTGTGIYVSTAVPPLYNVTVRNVVVTDWDYGIDYKNASNGSIENNTASNNDVGIGLELSSNNTITNNTASNNRYGIVLGYSNNNTITNNNANSNNRYGILLGSSSNNTIMGNTVNSNLLYGIWLSSSNYNTLTNNTASNNSIGIYLESFSYYNTLTDNTANSNNYDGIILGESSNNTLTGNNMSANTYNFQIYGYGVSHYVQTIDTTNTVDGKPIYYLVDVSDLVIDSSTGAGYVGVVNGINVTVKDLTLTRNGQGMLFVNTSNSSVLNVTASDNYGGICLYYSSSNSIANNTANSNDGTGISLSFSSNNTIKNNIASNNQYGISLWSNSSNNTITSSIVISNNYGISIFSFSNLIYNNFLANINNSYDGVTIYRNDWNTTKTTGTNIVGGHYLGGNYYSDYAGNDTDGDGIGDVPYTISSGSDIDYLPLVDKMPPNITINSPINNTAYNTSNINFDITISEPIDANAGVIVYYLDGSVNAGPLQIQLVEDTLDHWYNNTVNLADYNMSDGEYNATFKVWDLAGNPGANSTWFSIDTTLPNITSVSSSVTTTSATITWTTDENSNSTVYYGTTTSTTFIKPNPSFVTSHSITLNGLSSRTKYYYNVSSCDMAGNCNTSPQYSFTTNSGSGGGGSSSGGGGATSFEAWIKDVPAGQTFDLDIDDEDIPYIKGLSLTAKQDIYSSKLSITDLDKKPWYGMEEPDANVFRYFKVSYDKDNYVESAKFKVSVNKSWLKDNDIDPYKFSLYRYTNTWEELDTEILKEDNEDIHFEITTPGFSYFSLGGANGTGYRTIAKEEVSAPVEEETVEPPKIETSPPAPPVETPEPEQSIKASEDEDKGGICGPTVVVLLAMTVLLIMRRRTLS